MKSFYKNTAWPLLLLVLSVSLGQPVLAQKYKTLSDTTALNKDHGKVSLEIAKLNSKLIAEKNRTADLDAKVVSTTNEVATTGVSSKDHASTATSGDVDDTKRALKAAKKADRAANDSKNAKEAQKKNLEKIADLQNDIDKQTKKLLDLESQKTTLVGKIPLVVPPAATDSAAH